MPPLALSCKASRGELFRESGHRNPIETLVEGSRHAQNARRELLIETKHSLSQPRRRARLRVHRSKPRPPDGGLFHFQNKPVLLMPFDSSDDDAWWPNPWAPQSGPGGGASYPYDWTDPFINSRTAALNPVTSAPAPFSAAALGAMAWHPPIFLNGPAAAAPSDFTAGTWPQQPFLPGGSTTAPVWPPQSFLAPIAQLGLSGVPTSIGRPLGPFTPDPGLARGGPFGSIPGPDPTSPFAGPPFDPRVPAAVVPTIPGPPRASYTPGMPPRLPPLTRFQSPVETSVPALDPSSSPAVDLPGAPTAVPTRSVLFNQPPAPRDLGARERDLADLDEAAWNASPSGLPLSKSGQPMFPPRPELSTSYEQALYAAHLLSPNLVDYFTKEIPPPPPFPSTPGKIPSLNNPYAGPAVLEAATWLLPWTRAAGPIEGAAGAAERAVAEAAFQAVRTAAETPTLTRAAEQLVTGPYGDLSGALPRGFQAHHLNQNAVYGKFISPPDGFSVSIRGNIITEPGTPHYVYHRSMEDFWDQFRQGGSLEHGMPTNAQYGEASRRALIASGFSDAQASVLEAQAAAQRAGKGLSESSPVPNVPVAIWRRRRK
jgi:hypothetical protein